MPEELSKNPDTSTEKFQELKAEYIEKQVEIKLLEFHAQNLRHRIEYLKQEMSKGSSYVNFPSFDEEAQRRFGTKHLNTKLRFE